MAKSDSKLTSEIGVSGAHVHTGMQQEEFLPELRGHRAVKKYREMRDNDDVIGAILQAMDMLIRAVEWRVEAADDTPEAQADAEFAESVLEDMSHTFEDFISEVLSFLVYGWSFFEVVYKRREGPEQKDPSRRSKFDDGRLGIRKLAPRAQQTLQRWKLDDEGGVQAMVQQSGMGGAVEIPLEKGLLFRTVNASNSPSGRALDPQTEIPTPDGWRILDDIQPGDRVFDERGAIRYVTARADWEDRNCYEVEFGNGEIIVADENHLWCAQTPYDRKLDTSRVVTTKEIVDIGVATRPNAKKGSRGGFAPKWAIKAAQPIEYVTQYQPLDPYYLGLWLGDGNSRNAGLTMHVDDCKEVSEALEHAGYSTKIVQNGRQEGNGRLIRVSGEDKWSSKGPVVALRVLGLLENKHIPDCYLRGDVQQRIDLLAGLMDSDGHINRGSNCEFTNTNPALSFGVAELIRSLGMRANVTTKINDHGSTVWVVHFTPTLLTFRLSRKIARYNGTRARTKHYIHDVRPCSRRRTVCIEVDSPSHLFLASRSLIPTHNSVLRNAYRSYYYATHIENIEAIAIERELNGLPVGYIPGEYLRANAGSDKGKIRAEYEKMLRDVKFNEQGFIMLPSDTWPDSEGNPSSTPLVKIELLASNGTRNIETQPVIMRYRQAMARTVLADFIMLGTSERGSFALSKSKADLFLRSLEGYLNNIASTLNRHLISRLWKLNGLSPDTQPRLVPGDVAPVDLEELGQYVQRLSGSGFPIFPDEEVERSLLEAGGLPTEARGDDDLIGRSDGE